jgi:hypothetical protein
MKKAVFVLLLMLLVTAVFAQESSFIYINTSEGRYRCTIIYNGQNKLESLCSSYESFTWPVDRLSKGHWECVQRMLDNYQTTRGDTFSVGIQWLVGTEMKTLCVICEFSSDKQYRWRALLLPSYYNVQNF